MYGLTLLVFSDGQHHVQIPIGLGAFDRLAHCHMAVLRAGEDEIILVESLILDFDFRNFVAVRASL